MPSVTTIRSTAAQKLGQHRLSPGSQRLFDRAKEADRAVCTALDGLTTWVAVRRAQEGARAAIEAQRALADALEFEAVRMKALDRQARKLPARIKAQNARIKAEREIIAA